MAEAEVIDEDLQSRQMAVYGRESMQLLRRSNVLISGLNGLGAEVAKNVILANVKSVTLHDDKVATAADCGANFYLSEDDVGKNRAAACVQQMQELNPGVQVRLMEGPFPLEQLSSFSVVVAVDVPLESAVRADAFCRAQSPPIAFIRADVRGLCGSVFVDLGPSFRCLDPTGEAIKSAIVQSIYPLKEPPTAEGLVKIKVQCVDDDELELDDGDHIVFAEVEGMPGLNHQPPLPVLDVSKGRKCFIMAVPATAAAGAYTSGGLITEKRMPKELQYASLEEFFAQPGELWEVDESKMSPAATSFSEEFLAVFGSPKANVCYGRSGLLHLGFRALDAYATKHGSLPPPVDAAAADEVLAIAKSLNDASSLPVGELHLAERSTVIRQMAMGARAVLCPMAAIFGGIVGQEVVKAATGKFHPICQGFYMDALECLPNKELPLEAEFVDAQAAGRYEGQVCIFGRSFQARIQALRVFLVGSGALGCEFLKNLALMGVSTTAEAAETAKLSVTDDDIIEKSNLSRQFLFRNHDVGQSKSLSAVRAASRMNPALKAIALQDRVSPDTEDVFNSGFWTSLDVVINALDNVKARLYVDQQCVFYGKPLLESGTLGTKCNTQMVIPHLTENYGASRDAPEKEAPQCAVHNFPHNIDQCLVLAQSEFVGNFDTLPRELTEFLEKGASWVEELTKAQESASSILDKLRGDARVTCGMSGGCRDLLIAEPCTAWAECVGWARRKFESYFVSRINQLLHNFPPDAVTGQGVPFWSPPKRVPKPLPFDPSDQVHLQFVIAGAHLRAFTFGITPPSNSRDPSALAETLRTAPECAVTPFVPFSDASIETENKQEDAARLAAAGGAASQPVDDEEVIKQEVSTLLAARSQLPSGFGVRTNEFEKDDDTNHHMDFISAFGNLRARNYGIEEIDKFAAKLKAGRIIPAIATTTAMATGFVCLELYKQLTTDPLVMEGRRNLFANLALPGPLISLSEPAPCKKMASGQRWDPDMYMDVDEVAVPEGHTLWDHIFVPGARAMTLEQFFTFFAAQHKLKVTELLIKGKAVYSEVLNYSKNASNRPRPLVELIEELDAGKTSKPVYALEQIVFNTLDGDDVKAAHVVLLLS